ALFLVRLALLFLRCGARNAVATWIRTDSPSRDAQRMKFKWLPLPAQPLLAAQLASKLNLPTLLAQCLVNRQLDEPGLVGGFLEPRLKQLSDPFLLPDMTRAVDRLFVARQQSEPVIVFGDYDVDGVTSTALLLEFL